MAKRSYMLFHMDYPFHSFSSAEQLAIITTWIQQDMFDAFLGRGKILIKVACLLA